jgi:acetyl-CoA carboxylase biotin carboxyl carrier protein
MRSQAVPVAARFAEAPSELPLPNGMAGEERRVIQELIALLKESGLVELEVERQGLRIRLRRETGPGPTVALPREPAPVVQEVPASRPSMPVAGETTGTVTVVSPIVGTFYRSPSPDADPYVEEGDLVKKGQVLCVVEAMKLMNEIESEVDGRVVKILVESTKPVEYGQPLFLIEPALAS